MRLRPNKNRTSKAAFGLLFFALAFVLAAAQQRAKSSPQTINLSQGYA
jgi:hypothetical protein